MEAIDQPYAQAISLITAAFSDHDQVGMVGDLSQDDAQNFIDMLDEVSTARFHLWGQVS